MPKLTVGDLNAVVGASQDVLKMLKLKPESPTEALRARLEELSKTEYNAKTGGYSGTELGVLRECFGDLMRAVQAICQAEVL